MQKVLIVRYAHSQCAAGLAQLSVLNAVDEFQRRPDIVYRANFYIHEPRIKTRSLHVTERQVGGNLRALFWPGHPEHSTGSKLFSEQKKLCFQLQLPLDEEDDQIERFGKA